ncbi:MAG: MYXO-CTERM sorting domain-containing protein [Myxococcota bacterium]|jgi:uncharacterized protein (TIGR03382 family)|nr:MYXO-CTERM sorting domain-containing protein [Myxococcota bacterium]
MRTDLILPTTLVSTLLLTSMVATADTGSDSDLGEAETSYTGAVMLEGDVDITFDTIELGSIGNEDDTRYAFFSGNTLYFGTEDEYGNNIDAIAEFFWFESSIDRGSDFYVAVLKARTSPALSDDWELYVDEDPVLSVYTEANTDAGNTGFRWDWSLPFESYGIDSYGEVTLETTYGIGTNAEGSAIASESIDEDGNSVSGTVQAKGYYNSEYKVQTLYQVTLWRWEMFVDANPNSMEWNMVLNWGDRAEQNAYHEYFIVMQAEEGEPFEMDWLEVSGTVNNPTWYWWDEQSDLSAALSGLVLTQPAYDPDDEDEDEDDDDEGEDTGWSWDDYDDEDDSTGSDTGSSPNDDDDDESERIVIVSSETGGGCSTTGHSGLSGLAMLAGLLGLFGRRRD